MVDTFGQRYTDYASKGRYNEFRIPEAVAPPPAPKKKAYWVGKKNKKPPKNGYFNPPDLELLFAVTPVRQAWA
ncbi:unnamed protein product [Malus baccata var. baccata]